MNQTINYIKELTAVHRQALSGIFRLEPLAELGSASSQPRAVSNGNH